MAQQANGRTRHAHGTPSPDRKVLMQDLAMEASLLGGILLRSELLQTDLAHVEVDDFAHYPHKVVFEAMRNLDAAGKPIDIVHLENEIEKTGKITAIGGPGAPLLGELALSIPTLDNIVHYRDEVLQLSKNRQAILALSSALHRAQNWAHDPRELISEIFGQLSKFESDVGITASRLRLMSIDDALDDLRSIQSARVFPTPFPTLNSAMGFGGILGTQVYTVAGGTGRGKTSWVGQLAAHVAEQGDPVLISVHELGPGYFVARKAAGVLSRHSNEILRGEVDRDLVRRAMPYPNMHFLKRPTLDQLREAVVFITKKYGRPPLVIVDYLQKLADQLAKVMAKPDLRMATSEASTALLELGESTGAGIVAVSSIGRGKAALKTPRKFHPYELVEVAKESGAVEYDGAALIVLTLSDEFDGEERIGTTTLAKARFGTEMHIDSRYNGPRGFWHDHGEVEREGGTSKPATTTAAVPRPGREDREDVVREKIIFELHKQPARNKTSLKERITGCRKEIVAKMITRLLDEGVIAEIGGGLTLSPTGRQLVLQGAD